MQQYKRVKPELTRGLKGGWREGQSKQRSLVFWRTVCTLCSEGCRLNSTTSSSFMCRSTTSPTFSCAATRDRSAKAREVVWLPERTMLAPGWTSGPLMMRCWSLAMLYLWMRGELDELGLGLQYRRLGQERMAQLDKEREVQEARNGEA